MPNKDRFNIIDGSNLSLAKLHNIKKNGGSILRSAHIGNFSPQTLVIAHEQFPIILHEHLGGESRGYRPAFIFCNNKELQIAKDTNLPTCYLKFNASFKKKLLAKQLIGFLTKRKENSPLIENPAQLHFFALKLLFGASIQLLSQYLLQHTNIISDLINLFAKHRPSHFDKIITKEGKVLFFNNATSTKSYYINPSTNQKIILNIKDISKIFLNYIQFIANIIASKKRYNKIPIGITPSPLLYIIIVSIAEVYKNRPGIARFNKNNVPLYHFSGSYMMKYLIHDEPEAPNNKSCLNDLYNLAVKKFSKKIPARLDFYLVPTEGLQSFVIPLNQESCIRNSNTQFSQYDILVQKAKIDLPEKLKQTSMIGIEKNYIQCL